MNLASDPVWRKSEKLTASLLDMTGMPSALCFPPSETELLDEDFLSNADAVVTHTEVNYRHGVGVLLIRLFQGSDNVLAVRSKDHYHGQQDLAGIGLSISHKTLVRDAVFGNVLEAMHDHTIARILCIPYYPDDIRNALALKEIYGIPICTFLMDDQNVCTKSIPDDLMRELLEQSRFRLAISPELAVVYELKYGHRLWFMPPVVTSKYVLTKLQSPGALSSTAEKRTGIIVGNIWGQRWLDLLRETVRDSGVTLRWHTYDHFRFLKVDRALLTRDSILLPGRSPLEENELVELLRQMPFTVVPSGMLDESDDRRFISQLSLPSRIPFMLATSHIPVIVLGDKRTAAARFVEDLGIGTVCPYNRQAFRKAVDWITQPDVNLSLRKNALAVAERFSDEGALAWIWQSLAQGKPLDDRYEKLMPKQKPDLQHLVKKS